MDTIFALSSGLPPAGIGVIRVTGPGARLALEVLTGKVPNPRKARHCKITNGEGDILDDGLVLFFPAPHSVTGEDIAELHLHGGRAIVAAVEAALGALPNFRKAVAGEFTRRAFANGRIDLAEAEGLGDLLSAETELQRRAAIGMAGGLLSRKVDAWRESLLMLSAEIEAALDFDEEDEVSSVPASFVGALDDLAGQIGKALAAPSVEVLREGFRVALAGPPNAGKSTLFNALVENEAAITASIAGTTRDVLIRPVAISGVPFSFVDMAGLRDEAGDEIEKIGIARAEAEIDRADLILWLGPEGKASEFGGVIWEIDAQSDRMDKASKANPDYRLSALTGDGMTALISALVDHARTSMPGPGDAALNARQRALVEIAARELSDGSGCDDLLLLAENLRAARAAFDALLGRTATEDVLDTLFSRFCIGK